MTSTTPSKRAPGPADDSGSGLAMFVIFTAAVLIVTGAVALLSSSGGGGCSASRSRYTSA
jgi:hypothetical protein